MIRRMHVSWLALVGALAVAPLGTAAFGADSTTTTPEVTPPAATTDTAAPERKGDDVTVIQVEPGAAPKAEGTLADLVPGQMTAEDLIGKSVVNDKGETIGEINDIVLDQDKAVYAVLSVGGFLGIGADYVAVPFDKIQFNATAEGDSKVQIVANVTEDDLKQLAAAQRGETTTEAARSKPADATTTDTAAPAADTTAAPATDTAEAPATDTTAAPADTAEAPAADTTAAPAADTTTTTTTAADQTDTTVTPEAATEPAAGSDQTEVAAIYANVTAEDLIGKTVINSAGENIGEIEDLVIDDQKVVMAVVSVGGFLGIGEKHVAVPLEQLKLSEDNATLASGLTKEDLEKMPAYEKGKLQGVERGKPIYDKG
jgi:sporulation protein YlmC with PRC-barrel domain